MVHFVMHFHVFCAAVAMAVFLHRYIRDSLDEIIY